MQFRIKSMLAETWIVEVDKNQVYNGVSVSWVICKPSWTRVERR